MNGRSFNFHLEKTSEDPHDSRIILHAIATPGAGEEKATLGAGRSQGVRIGTSQFDLHPGNTLVIGQANILAAKAVSDSAPAAAQTAEKTSPIGLTMPNTAEFLK